MKKIIIFVLITLLFNCNQERKTDLKVEILNKEVLVVCEGGFCTDLSYEKISEINLNKIEFKIENLSNSNYVFNPISTDFKKGSTSFNSFPKLFTGISLNNFIIKTSKGKTLKTEDNATVFGGGNECDTNYEKKIAAYFKKQDYKIDATEALLKGISLESLIIIPKKTTLYFESYISLPYNLPSQSIQSLEVIKLNINEEYTMQMVFSADKEMVKKRLPDNLIKSIEEGSFKIFDGIIYSNEIPIRIE